MPKRITAKIEEYEKDGETKGKYVEVGVILSNENGEFMMLNPTVDLSGVLMKQRILAQKTGKKVGNNVMCGIWDNDNQGQQQSSQSNQNNSSNSSDNFDDSLPF